MRRGGGAAGHRPDEEAAPALKADIDHQGRAIAALYCDRGYVASPVVAEVVADGGEITCKPWVPRNGDFVAKADFVIILRDRTVTCPAGEVEPIDLGPMSSSTPRSATAAVAAAVERSAAQNTTFKPFEIGRASCRERVFSSV